MTTDDDAMAGPEARGAEPLRDRILSAAFGAFMEDGYEGASTLKIATRAKVSKRELYALFGSKQEILRACIATRARRMSLPETPPTPANREQLVAILTRMGARLLEEVTHPTVAAMHRLAVEESVRSPEIAQELEAVRDQNSAGVAELIGRAQAAGVVGPGDPMAMGQDFQALLLQNLILRVAQRVIESPDAAQAQARARHAADAFARLYAT